MEGKICAGIALVPSTVAAESRKETMIVELRNDIERMNNAARSSLAACAQQAGA